MLIWATKRDPISNQNKPEEERVTSEISLSGRMIEVQEGKAEQRNRIHTVEFTHITQSIKENEKHMTVRKTHETKLQAGLF